ncbi:MAG TPA: hypothetical protein VFI54_12595 [Solirubrobacteraceae bacterium]|nr:hypothetical protein [Solirubrobacteraceae bacterium]
MGVVLRAPEGAEPRHDDPFLIVDRELAVQAVSRNAELVLSVEEPASLGVPLEQFLICCNGDSEGGKLAQLVEAAFAGVQPSSTHELLMMANSEIRVGVRVTSCGAPPGALLVLTPLAVQGEASSNGRPAIHRQLASVGGFDSAA